jgi:hypothetical protein
VVVCVSREGADEVRRWLRRSGEPEEEEGGQEGRTADPPSHFSPETRSQGKLNKVIGLWISPGLAGTAL